MTNGAADFPLILAGPLLRRVDTRSVSVFLALREPRWVQLKLYADPDTRSASGFVDDPIAGIDYPLHPSVPLGRHLHVVLATVTIPASAELLPATYAYNTYLHTTAADTGESVSLLQTAFGLLTSGPIPLGYAPELLPTFTIPTDDLAATRIAHGSCRKPHGEGNDMLAELDKVIEADPSSRPHLLLLTGDQVYADDVDPILLRLLHDTSRALLGWDETYPGTDQDVAGLRTALDAMGAAFGAVAAAAGQPVPADLADALDAVLAEVEDPRLDRRLKEQLVAWTRQLDELLEAAGGTVSDALARFGAELAGWTTRYGPVFAGLSSAGEWGRPGVPRTEANVDLIEGLRGELALRPAPDDAEAEHRSLLDQLATLMRRTPDDGIEGNYFRHRLQALAARADALAANTDGLDPSTLAAARAALVDEIDHWLSYDPTYTKPDVYDYVPSRISPPQRALELRQHAALTSDAMTAHLMFLGEFLAMYLHTWSDAVWMADEGGGTHLPLFFDAVPNYGLTGALGPTGLTKAAEELGDFADGVRRVRRVLANVPTLMMFDDHEVTDDWNLHSDWVHQVNASAMGPQLLTNALAAYAVFQDWGNRPGDYAPGGPGRAVLDALTVSIPQPGDPPPAQPASLEPPPLLRPTTARTTVQTLFAVGPDVGAQIRQVALDPAAQPTTRVGVDTDGYAFVTPAGRKRWDWTHRFFDGAPLKVVCLDTRTHRGYPSRQWALRAGITVDGQASVGGFVAAANLVHPAELDRQLADELDGDLHLVISPAPVFGLPLVEDLFQRLSALASGPEVADFEAWQGNRQGFERLVDAMRHHRIVLLSGDVHYAYSNIISFLPHDGSVGPTAAPIVQLCSSSLKNESLLTRFLGNVGRENRLVDWLVVDDPAELLAELRDAISAAVADLGEAVGDATSDMRNFANWWDETAPLLNPLNPGAWTSYYLKLKDTRYELGLPTPWGLGDIAATAVKYLFLDMLDPFGEQGVIRHGDRRLQFLGDDRPDAARALRATVLNSGAAPPADLETNLRQQAEVAGYNNIGLIGFSPDTSIDESERISHELVWLTHDRRGEPDDYRASTIHGYVPAVDAFRHRLAQLAQGELDRWHPTGTPVITEDTPVGQAFIDGYYRDLRPANTALEIVPTSPRIGFYDARQGEPDGPILSWSATFISWIVWRAGARRLFFYSPRHIDYVRRCKANVTDDLANPFHLFDRSTRPIVGDLLVGWRDVAFSYDDVETTELASTRAAHVDVVVGVDDQRVTMVGGNISNTVARTTVTFADDGLLPATIPGPGTPKGVVGLIRTLRVP